MKLIGEKIILRDWEIADLKDYKFWNTGHKKWMDFDGPYYPKPTKEELSKQIEIIEKKISSNNFPAKRRKLVVANKVDNKIIGTTSWYWQSKETNWMSIGIAIYNENFWSKGIGFDALSLWIDYLFKQDKNLLRLDLRTWSGNFGMMKLAEKLGFKKEAVFRKARIVNDKYYDGIGYGILREEWFDR